MTAKTQNPETTVDRLSRLLAARPRYRACDSGAARRRSRRFTGEQVWLSVDSAWFRLERPKSEGTSIDRRSDRFHQPNRKQGWLLFTIPQTRGIVRGWRNG